MQTRILVTGAGGQLGKTIEELYGKNDQNLEFVFVTREELDISNSTELHDFFLANKFDYCINCAAYTNVEQAEKAPETAYKVNAESVKNLAETCKEFGSILIHISTDYVFNGEKDKPYTVDDIPNPINEYGKSKLQGERYIKETYDKYFIVRTSWLYSKTYGHNFYKTVLKKLNNGEELFVTREQLGCPTDTTNLSKYILELIKDRAKSYGVLHFTDGIAMTWFDFARKILTDNGFDNINVVQDRVFHTCARRPKNSVLRNSE